MHAPTGHWRKGALRPDCYCYYYYNHNLLLFKSDDIQTAFSPISMLFAAIADNKYGGSCTTYVARPMFVMKLHSVNNNRDLLPMSNNESPPHPHPPKGKNYIWMHQ